MTLFRPSVPRIPRDEGAATEEVSLYTLCLYLWIVCTNSRRNANPAEEAVKEAPS